MRQPPFGHKIIFEFDMPDGTKNGGITTNPDALYIIWKIYREHKGSNLVVRDETFYKDDDNEIQRSNPINATGKKSASCKDEGQ